jgi:signal peptidase II
MEPKLSWIFFSLFIFVDQISKIASDYLSGDFYFINNVCNKNISWSLPAKPMFFYPIWFAIIFFLSRWFSKEKNIFSRLALLLIISGAISNMVDRISYGCVIDFIDLKFWPVFNLADTYITLGIILLAFGIFKNPIIKHQKPDNNQ